MSNAWRSLAGTSARRSAGFGVAGLRQRRRLVPVRRQVGQVPAAPPSSASCSVAARKCPLPDTVQCSRAPPISSSVVFSLTTISTIRGLPRYIEALPSTMAVKSQNAGM